MSSSATNNHQPFDYAAHPHRRFNPLAGSWVLCSPHRALRPWQGAVEEIPPDTRPAYDPSDYLGPGNKRVNGSVNEHYTHTYVFDNDFMALLPTTPAGSVGDADAGDLLVARAVRGLCRVVCFSPKLNETVAEMPVPALRLVVDAWSAQYDELSRMPFIRHVQIFENKGEMMGCSNPHPHGQIWASEYVPEEPAAELRNLREYFGKRGVHMLEEYARQEVAAGVRVVAENESFVAVVPFWAVWPFEVMVVSKARVASLKQFSEKMKDDLADIYRRVACRYDNLFKVSFPYSMGIHQAPTDGAGGCSDADIAHFHVHFYPPLLRSATVRKFMVGFELLAEAQRDLTAEQAAARLRECSEVHFREKKQ